MQLFYAPNIAPPHYLFNEEESKHCFRVLRLGAGDIMHLTDGRGNLYRARITDPNPKRCMVKVIETFPEFEKRSYSLTMAVAPTKNIERFEWFLEKATEVGVDAFIPLESNRSERRVVKPERQMRVITAAVKQSLKAYHPQLEDVASFRDVVSRPFEGVKLIAHCLPEPPEGWKSPEHVEAGSQADRWARQTISGCVHPGDNVLILIGPEGDFSPEEITFALENRFIPLTLGSSRLRTETAALAAVIAVAIVNQ